jgi:hypothetical protein
VLTVMFFAVLMMLPTFTTADTIGRSTETAREAPAPAHQGH